MITTSATAKILRLLTVALVAGACGAPGHAAPVENRELPRPGGIVDELRKGGFVIYFRHALTEAAHVADDASDMARCETQRNLSPSGRAQAVAIGKSVKALGIPIGTVTASPFCRTRETAQLAFGRVTADPRLYFVMTTDARETKRLADALRQLLSERPANGTNTVLVSHSANLREAAGIFAKPEGAAYVFRPLPEGRFELVATILPEDWPRLAQSRRSGAPLARISTSSGARP